MACLKTRQSSTPPLALVCLRREPSSCAGRGCQCRLCPSPPLGNEMQVVYCPAPPFGSMSCCAGYPSYVSQPAIPGLKLTTRYMVLLMLFCNSSGGSSEHCETAWIAVCVCLVEQSWFVVGAICWWLSSISYVLSQCRVRPLFLWMILVRELGPFQWHPPNCYFICRCSVYNLLYIVGVQCLLVRACACAIGVSQTRWYHYNHWLFLFLLSTPITVLPERVVIGF